jgi:hypothetical protein
MNRRSRSARLLFGLALPALLAWASARAELPETVLHSFTQISGTYPVDGLVTDANGVLYGYASQGGAALYWA